MLSLNMLTIPWGSSFKEGEIVEVQEGKTNYTMKILLLGKILVLQ